MDAGAAVERRGARAAAGKVARPPPPVRVPEAVSQQLQLELRPRARQRAAARHVREEVAAVGDAVRNVARGAVEVVAVEVFRPHVCIRVRRPGRARDGIHAVELPLKPETVVARRRRRALGPVVASRLGDVAAVESRRPREVAQKVGPRGVVAPIHVPWFSIAIPM